MVDNLKIYLESNNLLLWDITLIVISTLIVLSCFKSKKKENGFFLKLQSFATENSCTISTYDHWHKTLIGFGLGKIFFIRNTSENDVKKLIDLSEVYSSRIVKTVKIVSYNGENLSVLDKIDLVVFLINNTDVVLEFYNSKYDNLTLTGELHFAQRWSEFINASVAKNNMGTKFLLTTPEQKTKANKRAASHNVVHLELSD